MKNYPLIGSALLATALGALYTQQGAQKPDENRFTPVDVIPAGILDEPMVFEVLRDGTVYVAERKGRLMMYDPATKATTMVDSLAVNLTYTNAAGQGGRAEEGFVGFTLDPNFAQNHWAYFIYAHPTIAKHMLTRMELHGDSLARNTEVTLLEWDVQREACCHTGGGMTWDAQGNLYITVGNNTGNVQGSQTDQRPGRRNWDDQRAAANTNDLVGKILRIRPQPDGSYTIPSGNLFAPGTPGTRPEIYTMGHRNVWRVSVDSRTGYIYWGEVGPDAAADAPHTVAGEDELNQARGPGFFGWPYFVGNNRGYPITDYTSCTGVGNQAVCSRVLPPKDPARPINDSRWNTGLRELPPAQPAFISYPYAPSERFPEVGTGGRSANGGPIYHRADFSNPARPWPAYYEGKWIASDLARGWIMAITMNERGDYVSMERFLPSYKPIEPIDSKFGPDGDLYVLEYGSVWFAKSPDARLVRIEYNAGNRAPEVQVTSNTRGGSVPFNVTLSAEGTTDPDNDQLRYEWRVAPAAGGQARTFATANPTVPFDRAGVYNATLTVRDPAGATATETIRIVAGNEEPNVAVNIPNGNRSFFFADRPFDYAVQVTDREDATVANDRVAFSVDYVPDSFDPASLAQADGPVDASTQHAVALTMIANSDCRVCHQLEAVSVGPSFKAVATRYQGNETAVTQLVQSIRAGSTGKWGAVTMPAHPAMSVAEAATVSRYILSTNGTSFSSRPLAGSFTPEVPEGDNGRGRVIVRAVYTDRGAQGLAAQTSEQTLVLRSPVIDAGTADVIQNSDTRFNRGSGFTSVIPRSGGYMAFREIDLTGVAALQLAATATAREGNVGGTVEVRLGSPTGQLLGQATIPGTLQPAEPTATQIQQQGGAGGGGGGGGQNANPPVRVEIPATTGMHDVYLVFRNAQARATDPVATVNSVTVVPR